MQRMECAPAPGRDAAPARSAIRLEAYDSRAIQQGSVYKRIRLPHLCGVAWMTPLPASGRTDVPPKPRPERHYSRPLGVC